MGAKRAAQSDVIVKLLVGAAQATPSPPVGPALGSKGVKSMDFCKASGHGHLQMQYGVWEIHLTDCVGIQC